MRSVTFIESRMTDIGLKYNAIQLRPIEPRDVAILFEHQLDPEANRLAGTRPRNAESFYSLWEKIFKDTEVVARVIVDDTTVLGGISCFKEDGLDAVGYWIAKEHWGKGVASKAVELFVEQVTRRPLHATVAKANLASMRVLEKSGFRITGFHMGEDTERYVGCEVATLVLD